MGERKDDLQKMRSGSLHAWSLADKLHLVAIGVVDIHGATGQDGMLAVLRLVSSGNERFDPTSLLWSVRTDEETHQLLKNSEDHLTNDEPFKDGSSASITSALSQVMR